jgi:hypothetical protein
MKRSLFAGAALLLSISSAAFAANPPPPTDKDAPAAGDAAIISTSTAATTTDTTAPAPAAPPPASANVGKAVVAATEAMPSGSMFVTVPAKDDLSSSVIGLDIYNAANQDVGTIKDIAFGTGGVKAYIVGVGGFLGMGDHYVAVRPSAITLSYDDAAKKWHATMDADATQLKAAPEYKYPTAS